MGSEEALTRMTSGRFSKGKEPHVGSSWGREEATALAGALERKLGDA